MRVVADLDKCVGHARCEALTPEVFATDEIEGKVVVLAQDVPPEHEAAATRGARACPERAISVFADAEQSIRLWPPQ